jgi:hypothetical protein
MDSRFIAARRCLWVIGLGGGFLIIACGVLDWAKIGRAHV